MLRVASYNILNGGEGRADPLAEVLVAQRADVICLIECSHDSVLHRIAKRLNMDVALATGGRDPVALLSRWPIVESVDHAVLRGAFTGSLLEAIVQLPGGHELPIGVVHLTARATEEREAIRMTEIQMVLDAFARYRRSNQPHLLAGDFNANSPGQQINPIDCKKATQQAWKENGGSIPRRVIQRLLDAGYVDTLAHVHGRSAETMTSFTTNSPGQRVDYVFSFGVLPQAAWIETDRLATFASDHYPVGCEFDLLDAPTSAEGGSPRSI